MSHELRYIGWGPTYTDNIYWCKKCGLIKIRMIEEFPSNPGQACEQEEKD